MHPENELGTWYDELTEHDQIDMANTHSTAIAQCLQDTNNGFTPVMVDPVVQGLLIDDQCGYHNMLYHLAEYHGLPLLNRYPKPYPEPHQEAEDQMVGEYLRAWKKYLYLHAITGTYLGWTAATSCKPCSVDFI